MADATKIQRKVGDAYFEIDGHRGPAPVIFGEKGDESLLGVTTLESLGLVLDPLLMKHTARVPVWASIPTPIILGIIWPFWGVRQPVSAGTHFPAFICSIYATLLLCRLCRGDRSRQWAMACYGATLILQYAASTIYHSVLARPELIHYLRLLDQTGRGVQ